MNYNKSWKLFTSFGLLVVVLLIPCSMHAQGDNSNTSTSRARDLFLKKAVMCEGIGELAPKNEAVTFPIGIGSVFCLTSFDPVPQKTFIYHHWFRSDKISTRIKLTLNPPRWSSYSSVRLREEDKGPWRVEIRDEENNLLETLMFSITD